MSGIPEQVGSVQWFTRARKVPSMIGRLHDGTRIWGGPYTLTQGFSAIGTIVVMWNTRWLWGGGSSGLIQVGMIIIVAWAVVYLVGHLPDDRNPLLWTTGALSAVAQPRYGRLNGRRVTLPPVQQVRGLIVIQTRESLDRPDPVADSIADLQVHEAPVDDSRPVDGAAAGRPHGSESPQPASATVAGPALGSSASSQGHPGHPGRRRRTDRPDRAAPAMDVNELVIRHSGVEALLAAARVQSKENP